MSEHLHEEFSCPNYGVVLNTESSGFEWQEKYNDILNFILKHNRFPSKKSVGYEYELNRYYTERYVLNTEGLIEEKQKIFFEKICSVSSQIKKEKWIRILKDILFFTLANARAPRSNALSKHEKRLAQNARHILNEYTRNKLDRFHIKEEFELTKKYLLSQKKSPFKPVDIAEMFYILHGHLPSASSDNMIERQSFELIDGFRLLEDEDVLKQRCEKIRGVLFSFNLDNEIIKLQEAMNHLTLKGEAS